MIKARDLIKEKRIFIVEGEEFPSLNTACESIAYSAFFNKGICISENLNRFYKLVNRLEREFFKSQKGYREGYEAGKKEVLDAFFPEESKKEIIEALKECIACDEFDEDEEEV